MTYKYKTQDQYLAFFLSLYLMRYALSFIIVILLLGCQKEINNQPLREILASNHPAIRTVMDNKKAHEIQIMVSEIIDNGSSGLKASTHRFQVDDSNYFYPASSVKFPVAVLALEKVNTIEDITSETSYFVEGDSTYSTIREDVKTIFAVSDNAAYNRLYEFLGRDYINAKLKSKGLQPGRITHRLESDNALQSKTKSLVFMKSDSTEHKLPYMIDSEVQNIKLKKLKKGKGYYKNGALVNESMDFSKKNYLPISTLHEFMKRVQFPQAFKASERFSISDSDHKFLLNTMQLVPRMAGYDEKEYYDGYVKFFMYGDTEARIPDHISISNKVGYAYGYLTDCAYIVDHQQNISFIVTATIHVNKDGIFNDDVYEYESVGIPFLAEIGRQLHKYYVKKNNSK